MQTQKIQLKKGQTGKVVCRYLSSQIFFDDELDSCSFLIPVNFLVKKCTSLVNIVIVESKASVF